MKNRKQETKHKQTNEGKTEELQKKLFKRKFESARTMHERGNAYEKKKDVEHNTRQHNNNKMNGTQ